jgi:hypothetical protein
MWSQKPSQSLLTSFLIILLVVSPLFADVMTEKSTQMEFKGALGMIMKFMGGNKPIKSVDYYKGEMYRSDSFDEDQLESSNIMDLANEKIIMIDHSEEQYTEMSFKEWQDMMAESMQEAQREQESESAAQESDIEWTYELDIERPGETETIAGRDAEKVILNLTVKATTTRQESPDEEPETSTGTMIVTSTLWMTEEGDGMEEISEFQARLAEKFGATGGSGSMADIMLKIMESNPQLASAMKKIEKEKDALKGFTLRSTTEFKTQGESSGMSSQEEEQKQETPSSLGGLFKGFGKKVAESVQSDSKSEENVLLISRSELTDLQTQSLESSVFDVPQGYTKAQMEQ